MPARKQLELEINGKTYKVKLEKLRRDSATVLVNDQTVNVAIKNPITQSRSAPTAPTTASKPTSATPKPTPHTVQAKPNPASSDALCAMMPGVVTKVFVQAGQKVALGEVVLILEAMKMENEIRSNQDGVIDEISVSEGQKVQTGEAMITWK